MVHVLWCKCTINGLGCGICKNAWSNVFIYWERLLILCGLSSWDRGLLDSLHTLPENANASMKESVVQGEMTPKRHSLLDTVKGDVWHLRSHILKKPVISKRNRSLGISLTTFCPINTLVLRSCHFCFQAMFFFFFFKWPTNIKNIDELK